MAAVVGHHLAPLVIGRYVSGREVLARRLESIARAHRSRMPD